MKDFVFICMILLIGCSESTFNPNLPPLTKGVTDPYITRAKVVIDIQTEKESLFAKLLSPLRKPAANPTTVTVTYVSPPNITFTLNTASLVANVETLTETLSLGSVTLSNIRDNNLKVCGVGGNQKCNQAVIRIYTTGSVAGFVQQTDLYGAPITADTLPVGLSAVNAAIVSSYTIPNNVNRVRTNNFSDVTYDLLVDMANAGAGNYSTQITIEYALGL